MVITSLGSDEAVESVAHELLAGQEVSLCRSDDQFRADEQSQPDQGDGILPGGRGRTTIFVDTSTVSLPQHLGISRIVMVERRR
jgi:hypothetical protein